MSIFSAEAFDKFLSEDCAKPSYVLVHSDMWNGFWMYKYSPKWFSPIIRKVGRLINSPRIYWLGRPLVWQDGMSKYIPNAVSEINENGAYFIEL